ncbi:urease accessory protein UreF [Effusibacillus pohliae]|uniref:urease accessory protein UreF n=1 Tax=Effusibacillus pohliae TaxID=232270 RepID=UPI00036FA563|nr:urease accessory protein UreF [Effusibacillus pohliae]
MHSLLPLLQLTDSAFPVGAFSHSYGLETALQENRVKDSHGLLEWLTAYLVTGLAPMEGTGVYWSCHYAEWLHTASPDRTNAEEHLKNLDRRLTLSRFARESREGAIKVGKRYLALARELYPASGLDLYSDWIRNKECYGHPAVVHGWLSMHLQLSRKTAVVCYLYNEINSLVQNALRAMTIGQLEAQKVLQSMFPMIEQATGRLLADPPAADALYSCSLLQEIEAMRHETLYSRLFMS